MKKALDVLSGLAVLAAFAAGLGALGAWPLSKMLPWTGGYGRAALWGLLQLGFAGLTFVLSIRNVVGLAVFLGSTVFGALWGLATLGAFRLCGALPGPYAFSTTFASTATLLIFGVVFVLLSRREKAGG